MKKAIELGLATAAVMGMSKVSHEQANSLQEPYMVTNDQKPMPVFNPTQRPYVGIKLLDKIWKKRKARRTLAKNSRKANRR